MREFNIFALCSSLTSNKSMILAAVLGSRLFRLLSINLAIFSSFELISKRLLKGDFSMILRFWFLCWAKSLSRSERFFSMLSSFGKVKNASFRFWEFVFFIRLMSSFILTGNSLFCKVSEILASSKIPLFLILCAIVELFILSTGFKNFSNFEAIS